jgi:FAD-linked oxidoreductase
MDPDTDFTFTNYGENLVVNPRNYFQPKSEAEVQTIVRGIAARGENLRVVGGGHSWSPVAINEENMLNLDALDGLVAMEKSLVTVMGGIRVHALNDLLDDKGLALPNLGSITMQSIAGACGTGTHGTGLRLGNMATMLAGMTLITTDGSRLEITEESPLMRAAAVSLGMLGVTLEVTLKCVPAHDLEYVAWPLKYGEAIDQVDKLLAENQHVRLYWFAGTDIVQVMTMNPTTKPRTHVNRIEQFFKDVVLDTDLLSILQHVGWFFPGLVGPFNEFSAKVGFVREERVDRSDHILTIPMPPRHDEMEYALPVAETKRIMAELPKLIEDSHGKVNLPIEYRFVAADQNLLSPAYGRDTVYVGAYTFGEKFAMPLFATCEPYFKGLGGRPHWGKRFNLTVDEIKKMYPGYEQFVKLREEMDPKGVFSNQLTRALFT